MTAPTPSELAYLLSSDSAHMVKRGLQRICDAIESGHRVDLQRNADILALIARQKASSDVGVRRWLYKLTGLLGDASYVPYLVGQLRYYETDPEAQSWIVASLFALKPSAEALRAVDRAGLEFYGTSLELAARYFRSAAPPLDEVSLKRALTYGGSLENLWLSLLYGRNPITVRKDVIIDLNRHHNAQVAEYSVWAVYRDPAGDIGDLSVYPQEIATMPANIRRWYYRLLTKTDRHLGPHRDLIEQAMLHDESPAAREGLALGLAEVYGGKALGKEMIEWFHREKDDLVRVALMRHFLRFRGYNRDYLLVVEDQLREGKDSRFPDLRATARDRGASIFVVSREFKREDKGRLEPVPRIVRTTTENVYVLGIDTIDFSSRPDSEQVQIFADLLNGLAESDVVRRIRGQELICLLTGDGLFAAFRNVENRHAPLRVALSIREIFAHLRTYRLRFGVNSGPASLIQLTNGSQQLIAHAVNWTARVMDAATDNVVLLSEHYYEENVRSASDQFPGYAFERVPDLLTKKGEPVPAYEAKKV